MRYNSVFSGMDWKERQAYRAKRKGELAIEKAKKQATAKTCQCCWRQIFAETGTIAHHGYERPGWGYQTASCMGAKFLPLEVSRDRLGDLIQTLKEHKAAMAKSRADAAAEKFPIRMEYANYNAPRVVVSDREVAPTVTLEYTRENFTTLVEENTGPHGSHKLFTNYEALCLMQDGGFDKIKKSDLKSRDMKINGVKEHLAECLKRFAEWKQTLKRVGDEWVNIKEGA